MQTRLTLMQVADLLTEHPDPVEWDVETPDGIYSVTTYGGYVIEPCELPHVSGLPAREFLRHLARHEYTLRSKYGDYALAWRMKTW